MNKHIRIVGQGYVGLPLAIAAAKSGYKVVGVDIDQVVVNSLNLGVSHIADVLSADISYAIQAGNYHATNIFEKFGSTAINVICVPTPLTNDGQPDLSILIKCLRDLSATLRGGDLIIIESTVAPGTVREILIPEVYANSEVKLGDLYFAYSPERIDPTNSTWKITNTPKLLSGLDEISLRIAHDFYSNFIEKIITCSSIEIAETAKLLENSFRLVNISLINEIAKFSNKIGLEVNEVIEAASTKPYGYMPFFPSLGAGGHCIPVDPIYLSRRAREVGAQIKLIEIAEEINLEMIAYFVARAKKIIGTLISKKILVIGISYKSNVSDVRQTPAVPLINELKKCGAEVFWHDDLVGEWNNEKSQPISEDFDLAILVTPHDYLELTKLGSTPILNTRSSK